MIVRARRTSPKHRLCDPTDKTPCLRLSLLVDLTLAAAVLVALVFGLVLVW